MTATWTLSTIRTYARERSGFGSTQITDSAVDIILNRIYRSFLPVETTGAPLEGFGSITTVIGQGEYDIDEETLKISQPITLDDGGGEQVESLDFYLDPVTFLKRFPEDASVDDSRPLAVMLYGNSNSTGTDKDNQLYVRPIPDAVYTIDFANTTRPKLLTSDSDPPVDDDMGYWLGIKTALEIIDTKAGGISDRKLDLMNDLKIYDGNLDNKKIIQMTGQRSEPRF